MITNPQDTYPATITLTEKQLAAVQRMFEFHDSDELDILHNIFQMTEQEWDELRTLFF